MSAEQGITQRVSAIGRAAGFLREVRAELKKVIWPDHKKTFIYTVVVFLAVLLMTLFIWGIDIVFTKLLDLIIK